MELLLALTLLATLVALLATSLSVYSRAADVSRTRVEEAQLARNVLGRIGDDLRAAVRQAPQEESSSQSGTATDATSDSASSTSGSPGSPAGLRGSTAGSANAANDPGADDAEDESEPPPDEEPIRTSDPAPESGLFGSRFELQIETSRLPGPLDRVATGDEQTVARPSPVKTVSYYIRGPAASSVVGAEPASSGLVRRVLDRASVDWASSGGGFDLLDMQGELLAAEVTAIEFRYFDGAAWQDWWDSGASGRLPVAVQIAVAVGGSPLERATPLSSDYVFGEALRNEDAAVYHLVIPLPVSQPSSSAGAP